MPRDEVILKGPVITLTYKVGADRRKDLLEFLASAVKVYEEPGSIRVALFESIDQPGLFCELIAYATDESYKADQIRVESDERMKNLLKQWHSYFDGPLEVRRLTPVALVPNA